MITLQNPEELLEFLVRNYDSPYIGKLMFEGSICKAEGIGICSYAYVLLSPKYTEYIFFIQKSFDGEHTIISIGKSGILTDQLPSVVIPDKYVAGEIAFEITKDERYMYTNIFL